MLVAYNFIPEEVSQKKSLQGPKKMDFQLAPWASWSTIAKKNNNNPLSLGRLINI